MKNIRESTENCSLVLKGKVGLWFSSAEDSNSGLRGSSESLTQQRADRPDFVGFPGGRVLLFTGPQLVQSHGLSINA